LTCGTLEGLLLANREFAARLNSRSIGYEFHEVPGGHDWNQWNGQIKSLFTVSAKKTGSP